MALERDQIAILSSGVWRLRDAIRAFTGCEPVRWMPPLQQPKFGCVAGWGLKPTSRRARELAKRSDTAYIALEDGFIRSVFPGPASAPLSFVMDRNGIHYDASAASDLEQLVAASADNFSPERLARARAGRTRLRAEMISKYNHAPQMDEAELGLDIGRRSGRVLVIDQTAGDSSIEYGAASATSFQQMLRAAIDENPGAEIVVKIHPEVIAGTKQGYLTGLTGNRDIRLVSHNVNPWSLIEAVDKVYVVTSQFGLEAVLGGCEVICFGAPFYAGWGLTDDRVKIARRTAHPTLDQLFAALYFDYSRYVSPVTGDQISFEQAVDWLIDERARLCPARPAPMPQAAE